MATATGATGGALGEIYAGTAQAGRVFSWIGAIGGTIISVLMIAAGIYLWVRHMNTEGIGMLLLGMLLLGISWLQLYLVRRFKGLAAIEGVAGAARML